jgi:hypothetical protein
MSVAALFLFIGLLLLVLLVVFLTRLGTTNGPSTETRDDEEYLGTRWDESVSQELTDRIFGPDDCEFVTVEGTERLRRIFLAQRKALALSWLGAVRTDMSRLMRMHRISARASSDLKPVSELRVALGYFFFQIVCQLFVYAIWLHGPAGMRGIVRRIGDLSGWVGKTIDRFMPTGQGSESNAATSYTFK